MVYLCFIVITTCYRSIIQCREHIASYVAYLCSIVAKAFQHILHRMKIYLIQSAPNNIIWEIIFIDTDYWLFNRYGLNHQLHQFVYVHLLCRMALKQSVITATKKAPSNLDSKEYFYSSLIRLRTVLGSLANKLLISAYSIRNRFDIYL